MSKEFQIQLIRRSLEDLGYPEVAQTLDSLSNPLPLAALGKSLAPGLGVPIMAGNYDKALQMLHLLEVEFDFGTQPAQISQNRIAVVAYLLERSRFLENVIHASYGDDRGSLMDQLEGPVRDAYAQIDTKDESTDFVSQLSTQLESAVLLTLALVPPKPLELLSRLMTTEVLFNVLKPRHMLLIPQLLIPQQIQALRVVRTALSTNVHHILATDAPASSWEHPEIAENSLLLIIEDAMLHRISQSPYYLPPRLEPAALPVALFDSEQARDSLPIHQLHTLTDHTDEVWFTRFSPLGRFLATGSLDGTCIIYDVEDGFKRIAVLDASAERDDYAFVEDSHRPLPGKKKGIIYLCWEPLERYVVTCCFDTIIRVWNVARITQKVRRNTRSHDDADLYTLVSCFTLGEGMRTWPCEFLETHADVTPHFVVGSPDKVLKVYSINGREVLDFYSDADEWLDSNGDVSDSKDPDTAPSDSKIDPNVDKNSSVSQFNRINDFAVTPDGKVLITANNDKQVQFYKIPEVLDMVATTSRIALITLNGRLTSCAVSANGRYMLLSIAPEELQVWDISPLERQEKPFLKQKFLGHKQRVFMIRSCFGYLNASLGQEEYVLSGSDDGFIYLWRLSTGQLVTRVRGHDSLCNAVDWNRLYVPPKNGIDYGLYWSSVGDDKLVKIWGPKKT